MISFETHDRCLPSSVCVWCPRLWHRASQGPPAGSGGRAGLRDYIVCKFVVFARESLLPAQNTTELTKAPAREDGESAVVLASCLGQFLARGIDCAPHLPLRYKSGARLIPRVYGRSRCEHAVYAFAFLFIPIRYDEFTPPSPRCFAGVIFGPRFEELYHSFGTCLVSYRISVYVVCK